MLDLRTLLELLGYNDSPHFRKKESDFEPESVHLFRLAKERTQGQKYQVKGFYVFNTSETDDTLPTTRPAVCAAEAATVADARKLHKHIWNLGNVPFLLVRLPDQIRVYSGFRYDDEATPIVSEKSESKTKLREVLSDFTAASIDSARIWQAQRERLDTQYRVDTRLLANLSELAQALSKHCHPKLDSLETAHALIGKYVYLRYLRDRNILSDKWLEEREVDLDQVFGQSATVVGLKKLVDVLEARFNGDIFRLDFKQISNSHVQLVSSVFAGDAIYTNETGFIRQLHLKFQAYDFRHIPVETLSSIYEQFLHAQQKGKSDGAYYTPEILADYLISEINSVRELQLGMRILDASAGSGIFLVLAYRRLIELERRRTKAKSVDPTRLREILLESIYGVERQRDACNVAIFSLILTLLNYVDPPELHANEDFRFPSLFEDFDAPTVPSNEDARIFRADFFNPALEHSLLRFHENKDSEKFDIIVGNPPWTELTPRTKGEDYARSWIKKEKDVTGNSVSEAFVLKTGRLLTDDGVAGLLLKATTLFNLEAKRFRQNFFKKFSAVRITNFANLRSNLFGGRVKQPATTLVFRKNSVERSSQPILHVAPFAVNQEVGGSAVQLWALTIHGSDMQWISQSDALKGDTATWKLALWGTMRDARALDRVRYLFPLTLTKFCKNKGWGEKMPRQGAELRSHTHGENGTYCDKLSCRVTSLADSENEDAIEVIYCAELKDKQRFDTDVFNQLVKGGLHFSIPSNALPRILAEECYVRKRGGLSGLAVNRPPHLLISATWKNFLAFSDDYFAVPARQMAISGYSVSEANLPDDANLLLRALAVYLGSSLVDYFVFFQVPEWGVYSDFPHVALRAIREIPTPNFEPEQVAALAKTHQELIEEENNFQLEAYEGNRNRKKQLLIDKTVFDALNIPNDLRSLIQDFRDTRLPLDKGRSVLKELGRRPSLAELESYGRTLQDELERFLLGEAHVSVEILASPDLIVCEVNLYSDDQPDECAVTVSDVTNQANEGKKLRALRHKLSEEFSQWVYVDRCLRLFTDDAIQIFKAPRLMDWTQTQALNDADDLIAEILANGEPAR